MNRYQLTKQLGDGTYGSVLLATHIETGEKVAVKKMKKKYYSWDECLSLREVKSLRKLNHPNIVKLKEVIRENDMLYFVFEFMKENLYQMMKDREKLLPGSVVRNIIYQVLQGLAYMHKQGFFHRDLKPENLLCAGPELVKIADFGLARETRSRPPYTDYVSTRWYRAPEVLLRSTNYSSPIDIWALGCIMAELYTLRPLFPGSSEIDQIFKTCTCLGTPSKEEWPEGYQLASSMNYRFPQTVPVSLKSLIPSADKDGLDIMARMLKWNPSHRPGSSQCLRHPYFQVDQTLGVSMASSRPQVASNHSSHPTQAAHAPAYAPQPAPTRKASIDTMGGPGMGGPSTYKDKPINPSPGPIAVTVPRKQPERKRWGTTNISEKWDDWDDLDFSLPSKKPIAAVKPKYKEPEKANDDFDDDFLNSILSKSPSKPAVPTAGRRMNSGRSSARSAKQHYLSSSRYHPGLNPLNSGMKRNPLGAISRPNLDSGLRNFNTPASKDSGGGYMPSFGLSNKPSYAGSNMSWKRAQPGPLSNNPGSNMRQPLAGPVPGRTDWAAKYLKS
ncbi:serine/threonine-protein kinase ICK-like [Haliotis rufescens]|uniref:serine/threonine-protein kinase ICK-like n=1 Tax=Haliotis rufescens TaxID=6454 RepID=UPI001EB09F93|nr:serine/threonine-protein kinase ICK-like [Haliotis rufescens]